MDLALSHTKKLIHFNIAISQTTRPKLYLKSVSQSEKEFLYILASSLAETELQESRSVEPYKDRKPIWISVSHTIKKKLFASSEANLVK